MIGTPNGKITPTPENTYFSNNSETGFWQSKKTFTEILEEDGHRKEHGQPRPLRAIMRNDTLYTIDSDSIYVGFDGIGRYTKISKKD